MQLSNACKPPALPSPVQGSTEPVNRAGCCFSAVFQAWIKSTPPPQPPGRLLNTHVPLCSSGVLPKSLAPLFISINPLNVPFFPPLSLTRALPAACCCCRPVESSFRCLRKRERFMCVCECVCECVERE